MAAGPLRLACAFALAAQAGAGQQAPDAAWRTLATAHYRIHYPPILADWAQEVGARIEGIHQQVVALVGYESPLVVQVVLVDPLAEPNGMALPLLTNPHVLLYRTEPRSDDLHGNALSSWTEELVSHELTHIHHLTRPTRPATLLGNLFGLPLGPLFWKCPRWVTEGYATLAEGRITGSGRPHSALRAAMIRQWARSGKLPPYRALSATGGYQGGNMAYLVGSAYLEWLERQRPGQPDLLQRFWKQLASRRGRSFEAAFLATFGFSAETGYQRFQAEAAHDALEWELRLRTQGLREGELMLRAPGTLRNLAVSPDGTRILAALESPKEPGLRIWDLREPPAKPPRVRPDPLNAVPDLPPDVPSRPPAGTLPRLNHHAPLNPAWVDGRTIRFELKHADREGVLRRRPALWSLPSQVDLNPDHVPQAQGAPLLPVRRKGVWVLELDGQPVPLPGPPTGPAVRDEARSTLWVACEVDGICNIVKVPWLREGGGIRFLPAVVMTRTASAAWNPAPSPDGRTLYFTTLNAEGMELRKLDLALPALAANPAPEPRILSPGTVIAPAPEPASLPRAAGPLPSAPYRAADHQWIQLTAGASLTPSGESWQLGVGGTDLLGRLSWQVLAGLGDVAGPRGAMAGVASAAWAWRPAATLFAVLERPSAQRFLPVAGADRERRGGELSLTWEDRGDHPWWISPVLAAERVTDGDGAPATTRALFGLRGGLQTGVSRGAWGLAATPVFQWLPGASRGVTWSLLRASLDLKAETPVLPVILGASGGRLQGGGGETFRLGGTGTSLVPESLDANRVEQPALPAYAATGDRFLRWRGQAGENLRLYLEGTSVWNEGQERPPWERVAGLEWVLVLPQAGPSEATLRRTRLQLGIHRPLDGEMKGHTVATLSLIVRP